MPRVRAMATVPPQLPATSLARPHLQAILAEAAARPLLLVAAGPGYGKTHAVRRWLHENDKPFLWLNLGKDQRTPAGFLRTLIRAVRGAGLPLPEDAEALVADLPVEQQPCWDPLIHALLAQPGLWLVLDDMHALDDGPALAVLAALIEEAIPDVCFALIGRHEPTVPGLARWRLAHLVTQIGLADLRFSDDDQRALLRTLPANVLPETDWPSIIEQTDGWVAGLILAAQTGNGLSAAIGPAPGGETLPGTWRYWADSVLAQQPPELRRFLLRASLLPTVSPAACAAAWGETSAERHLQELVHRHLFIVAAGADGYGFHPLFLAYLQAEAARELPDDEVATILGVAAEEGDAASAVSLSLQGDHEQLAHQLLGRTAAQALCSDDPQRVRDLLDGLPAAVQGHPWQRLLQVQALRHGHALAEADRVLSEVPDSLTTDPHFAMHRAALAAAQACSCLRADAPACTAAALALVPPAAGQLRALLMFQLGGYWFRKEMPGRSRLWHHLALRHFTEAGDLWGQARALGGLARFIIPMSEALAMYEECIRLTRACRRTPPLSVCGNASAYALYTGDVEKSAAWMEAAMSLADATGDRHFFVYLRLIRAQMAMVIGDLAQAQQDLEAAEGLGESRKVPWEVLSSCCWLAIVEWHRQRPDEARRRLDKAVAVLAAHPELAGLGWVDLALGQVAYLVGDLDLAESRIAAALSPAATADQPLNELEALAVQIRLLRTRGRQAAAEAVVTRYAALCQAVGFAPHVHDRLMDGPPAGTAAAALPKLYVRCFGRMEATDGQGHPLLGGLQGLKPKMLLALLLQEPGGWTRDDLEGFLYPERDVTRNAVIMLVRRLRDLLDPAGRTWSGGGPIGWRQGRYAINPHLPIASDLQEFLVADAQARAATDAGEAAGHYRRMITLYRGPLFAEFAQELWAWPTVQRTASQWRDAHAWLQSHLMQAGRHLEALELAERHLELEPAGIGANRGKLAILERLGQLDAARDHRLAWQALWRQVSQDPFPLDQPTP